MSAPAKISGLLRSPEFKGRIRPPIISYRYRKNKNRGGWQSCEIKDLAEAFYHAFRCGIVHSAMILDYGRISGGDIVGTGKVVSLRKWGNEEREVAVNPFELLTRVEKVFDDYVDLLRDKANRRLRINFARKFLRSFGAKVVP